MTILVRKVGYKRLFQVQGMRLWHWTEKQAIEHYEAYGWEECLNK